MFVFILRYNFSVKVFQVLLNFYFQNFSLKTNRKILSQKKIVFKNKCVETFLFTLVVKYAFKLKTLTRQVWVIGYNHLNPKKLSTRLLHQCFLAGCIVHLGVVILKIFIWQILFAFLKYFWWDIFNFQSISC